MSTDPLAALLARVQQIQAEKQAEYEGPTREDCRTCGGTGRHPAWGSPNCPQPECPTCEGRRR